MQKERNINGISVSYKIVGPSSGPLYPWMLNDYTPVLTPQEAKFNEALQEVRNYADSVIARLRSRFLILSHMMDLSYKVAPQVIAACCIIHNICERGGDPFLEEWLSECAERTSRYPQPEMKEEWEEPDKETLEERDAFRDYISANENAMELIDF